MSTLLDNVDASWLRMEEPANHMVVTGVLVLDRPVTQKQVRELLVKRLLRFERFRQRIVEAVPLTGLRAWEEDSVLSIDRHLTVAHLPEPGDEAALQTFASELASRPLPADRPPWQLHFVPHYQGGSALVVRIHHCVGDGLALVHVLLSTADEAEGTGIRTHRKEPAAGLWETVTGSLAGAARTAAVVPEVPGHLGALVRLLLLPPDPPTPLKGRLSVPKKLVWSRPFDLDAFKAIGRATGATVNDVLMTALAGALRRYLLARGTVPRKLDVRGVVPVNLRPASEAHRLGNRFGLVFLPLPLGLEDPRARLDEVRRRMQGLKGSPDAAATFELLWAMALAPRPVFDLVVDLFATKATAVVTNVVGPREAISLVGVPLRQAMFWVPCAGHLGLGVSLLSYAGRVWVGVQSDIGLVPDPERILAGFEAELEALRAIPAPGPRRRAGGGQEPGRARSDRIRRRSAPGRPSPARPAPS